MNAWADEGVFTLIVLNRALRNGDAHLKNFAVVADTMALTLEGSTRWPSARRLRSFGETRGVGGPAAVRAVLERVGDAVAQTARDIRRHMIEQPSFADVGERMLQAWSQGAIHSLGLKAAFD